MSRQATHAGSWYSANDAELVQQLDEWLAVPDLSTTPAKAGAPLKGLKAIIAPADTLDILTLGLRLLGLTVLLTRMTNGSDRVFVLGPSHHKYIDGCALTSCTAYDTPLGPLPIDLETVKELRETGKFVNMSLSVDEDEHSIEMHLPYIRHLFRGRDIKLIPILVGAISTSKEAEFGTLFSAFLAAHRTLFVISSDFCHWGTRFAYTHYEPSSGSASASSLDRSPGRRTGQPIWQSIEALDRRGMDCISSLSASPTPLRESHANFAAYLRETRNTICGRHPIGVLLATAATLQEAKEPGWAADNVDLCFVKYEQSSQCVRASESSVSYASAVLRLRS